MLRKVFIVLLLVVLVFDGWAKEVKRLEYAQKLTISEGLPHNGVTSMIEDSKGYCWIGTYDGLCRYDGYRCKVYKNTLDANLFVSNRIRTLFEDSKNNIWIGTDDGISIYNYSQEHFNNIYTNRSHDKSSSGPIVRNVIENSIQNKVFCATEGDGILVFDHNYDFIKQYLPSVKIFDESVLFFDGIELDSVNYLYSTSVGLVNFNSQTGQFLHVLNNEIKYSLSIRKIDHESFLVTLSSGIAVIKYARLQGTLSFETSMNSLRAYNFNCSSVDKQGNLWLGTLSNGIIKIDNLEAFIHQRKYELSVFTDETSLLRSSFIFVSENSGCWVGTFNKGIFRFNTNKNPFKSYDTSVSKKLGPRTNEVRHLFPLDSCRLFLSALRGGITIYNTQTEHFETLPYNLSDKIVSNGGYIFVDLNRNTWLNFPDRSNLFRIKVGKNELEKIRIIKMSIPDEAHINSMIEDDTGNIWIASVDGVYRIRIDRNGEIVKTESLNDHPFFNSHKISMVRVVYKDPVYNFIWIGTHKDGLFRLSIQDDMALNEAKISKFINDKSDKKSISSNFVTSILRLPNDELYVGTEGGGVCKVLDSNAEARFVAYTEKQGLSNDVVKAMLCDSEQNIWISTNIGLNKFYPKDNRFRKFSQKDGLPFDDFTYASSMLSNGMMVFAGLNGICYFNPEEVLDQGALPRLSFGDLRIFNKPIHPGDTVSNRVLLDKRLDEMEKIVLKYNENVFSIELSSLHYSTPENHRIKYQLLPINSEWVEIQSNQRFIHYNGLPPGKYALKVMASNSLNNWTEPKLLNIEIKPPIWQTIPAYLGYFVFLLVLLYAVISFFLRINALKHKLEIEQIEKDSLQEINAAKLRFFSNISHEIKTPLTIISGPLKEMTDRYFGNQELNENLQLLQRQSKKIFQLVDQVTDFQRAEAYQLKLNYSCFNFSAFISDVTKDFYWMAKTELKTLNIEAPDIAVFVTADMDKLEKILNNLLSNAFKHTKANDEICIQYELEGHDLIIRVSDSGEGIHPDDLPHIFNRFYQSQRCKTPNSRGSGIGLAFTKRLVEMHYGYISAESIENKITTIQLRLPIVSEEKIDNPAIQKVLEAESNMANNALASSAVNFTELKVDGGFSESLIFFVEDNAELREFVSTSLSKYFKVKTFSDGKECLDGMLELWPDLVLSDVQMPNLSGFDLCKFIKSDIKTSHIPVVLLTACATIEEQILGLKEGADDYIIKPFHLEHLIVRIESLLQSRKKLRERFQIEFPLTFDNTQSANNDNLFLEKLYRLMAKNLDNQDLEMDAFARELYLNRTHFYQKVKALTNQTPFELLKMYRLKKSAELLVQEKLSVNEVYTMTGFKSRTHFSKLFKELYGVTPGKYAAYAIEKYS